jgi:response regulator RpfG family c-di-GMP phosphodiesterase
MRGYAQEKFEPSKISRVMSQYLSTDGNRRILTQGVPMDTFALLQPRIRDVESLHEFHDALTDQVPNIEQCVAQLKRHPGDKKLIADLFRALHNIKGDAALCKIDMGVMIAHPIETLLGRLRSGEVVFSELFAEAILLAMDRLELATEALVGGQKSLSHLKLVELVEGLEELSGALSDMIDEKVVHMIEAVTGFRPASAKHAVKSRNVIVVNSSERVAADLEFFHTLALQYEIRSPLFKGRSKRQLQFALDSNEVAGNPIDPLQLKAAVYMHDLGMMFLPEALWLKVGKISEQDKLALRCHPGFGNGLLLRMDGWQPAAEMVLQHHEMPDGGGYPQGLQSDQISPGAKILAVIDTFEAVMLKHSKHGGNRSLVRAIAEINACDNQFAPEWIAAFNTVVRRMVEG